MSNDIDKDWLASLLPEREWISVLPYRNQPGGRVVPVKLVRRTATQLVVLVGTEECRYRAKDGRLVGGGWEHLPVPATEEAIAGARKENRRLNMVARLRDCNFSKLPYETVEAMFKLLPAKASEEL